MSECNTCFNDERLRNVENTLTQVKAEINVYIRQLTDSVNDIKAVVESLKNKQMKEAEIKNIVRETVEEINNKANADSKMMKITIEITKILGTAIAIIGGMQVIG